VLGAAWIAGAAVLPAIGASRNGRLVSLASRDIGRARRMIEYHSGARALATYEELLEQPDVDAVYIPLVNSLHREWTLRALAAGKHVLCEKPLAMNAAEAETMAGAATSSRKLLMEAFMYRFHPAMRAFVDAIENPLHVQASFGFRLDDPLNYRLRVEHGGGALLDVGCYTVNVARWILGEPVEVVAHSRMSGGVDMTTTVMLQFAGGRTASLWSSFESPEEQQVRVVTVDSVLARERPFTSIHDPHDPYQLMVESFADSVITGTPAAISLQESIANMHVLDRIREVAASTA